MSELEVRPVQSRRQRRLFLEFPWRLYRDDPLWVPPLQSDEAALAGYRPHPFYQTAESQTFLATRGGEVCGRIAANVLPAYQLHGVGLALMGALLPKALEWGAREVEFSWVAESNALSRGALEKGGARRYKTYRVFDLD